MARIVEQEQQIVPASAIQPHPKNPRIGDVSAIRESIEANGFYGACIVQRSTGFIIAGTHRYHAAVEAGMAEIPVIYVDLSDEEAKRVVLADNRTSDLGSYNDELLAGLLEEVNAAQDSLLGTGWSEDALRKILGPMEGKTDPDEIPEPPKKPKTKPGDLWLLGDHRLLCGDSKSKEDLDRLYAEATVDAILTDPPYGIDLDTDYSKYGSGVSAQVPKGHRAKTYERVEGDAHPFDASSLRQYFSGTREQFWFGANYYRRTLSDADLDGSWLVWDKRKEGADDFAGSGFELIWSAVPHKQDLLRVFWFGMFGSPEARNRVHPTQKPVGLLEVILDRWTSEEELIADPFLGSGSSLIAAERVERVCYGMEIDPVYVDVAVQRWEEFTGRRAQRA